MGSLRCWNHLLDRLTHDKVERIRRTVAKRHAIERDIEDRLAADLTHSDGMDANLELRAHQPVSCRRGGRADLVTFDARANRYVIVELKRGPVSHNADRAAQELPRASPTSCLLAVGQSSYLLATALKTRRKASLTTTSGLTPSRLTS